MIRLYASPLNQNDPYAKGFFFESPEEYDEMSLNIRHENGNCLEEYDLLFIEGAQIDRLLFNALYVCQTNFPAFFRATEDWSEEEKVKVIVAVDHAGQKFHLGKDNPDRFDGKVEIHRADSFRDLAFKLVDERRFGKIPAKAQHYLDYKAIALDLAIEYREMIISGKKYIYRYS